MPYFAPYIDSAGLHIPTYIDIRDDLIAQVRSIYGQNIYLGNDSQDYQYISVFALKISDTLQTLQLVYNNRSPNTAIGSALDGLVKLNGLSRKKPAFSTCQVTLTGTPGTVITNGIASDVSGNQWFLPTTVTLDDIGQAAVSAVCGTIGFIVVDIGSINSIVTPTGGWTSITNLSTAVLGQLVEQDYELRSRQAVSTMLPSQSLLGGTVAGIKSVLNVNRYEIYENDTGVTDANGIPSHSIAAVVEGGLDNDIANQIYYRKNGGCGTFGTTSITIADIYGIPATIRFYRPTYVPIFATIGIKGLSGYTTATTAAIKGAVVNYLNSLKIGEDLTVSVLWGIVLSVMPNLSVPQFAITSLVAGKTIGAQGTTDITILFNQVSQGLSANVVVNVT